MMAVEPWDNPPPGIFDDGDELFARRVAKAAAAKANGVAHNAAAGVELPPPAEAISDLVARLAAVGRLERLPTGIDTLDSAMRGGLPTPRLVILGGAPGAGKTSVAVRLGYQWAQQGIVVGFIAADEGGEGVSARIALYTGCKPALLDEGNVFEWERLEKAVAELQIHVADAEATVEAVAKHVRKLAGDRPAVLVVDSLQTVRVDGEKALDPRQRIDGVVRSLKLAVSTHRLLILATCEIARSFYRNAAQAQDLNALAAFKESGSIEYAAQTALVLTTPKGQHDVIDVKVAKNRGYQKRDFRLRLHEDLTFNEIDMPEASTDDEPEKTTASHLEADVARVVRVLLETPGVNGKAALRTQVRLKTGPLGDKRVDLALASLESSGHVENRGTPARPVYHYTSTPRMSDDV